MEWSTATAGFLEQSAQQASLQCNCVRYQSGRNQSHSLLQEDEVKPFSLGFANIAMQMQIGNNNIVGMPCMAGGFYTSWAAVILHGPFPPLFPPIFLAIRTVLRLRSYRRIIS